MRKFWIQEVFCKLFDSDLDIKPINKRASGQAFEVILKPPSPVSEAAHSLTSPPKRDLSLEDIQKKLEAAEDRRKVSLPLFSVFAQVHWNDSACVRKAQSKAQNQTWLRSRCILDLVWLIYDDLCSLRLFVHIDCWAAACTSQN